MPKKSRRKRGKEKATGNSAFENPCFSGAIDSRRSDTLQYSAAREREAAMFLYQWPPSKDRFMELVIDEMAADPRTDDRFNKDCIPPSLLRMLKIAAFGAATAAASQSESTPDQVSFDDPLLLCLAAEFGIVLADTYFLDNNVLLHPLHSRKKYVEDIINDARGLISIGRGDLGAALYNFGMSSVQTQGFCAAFLIEWNAHLWDAKPQSADLHAFWDENAKRAMMMVSSNEDHPMHVRALATVFRALIAYESNQFHAGPCPVTATYFRRALVYGREIQAGEMRLPDDLVWRGVSAPVEIKEGVDLNLELAKKALSFYEGPPTCVGATLLDTIANLNNFPPIPNYLTTGGSACDHCGKAAEEVGLPCLHKCKQCRMAFYCSVECQSSQWSDGGHREHCKKFGRFNVGDKLVLFGLKKRWDLNMSLAEVVRKASPERLNVRICYPTNQEGTIVAAKKKNLRHHRPMK